MLTHAQFRDGLVISIHNKALQKLSAKYIKGDLIDIGCGTKPYKAMMAPLVQKHVGVDHEACLHDKSNIDLMGTAYSIPAPAGQFDSAICTAVLEHLEEPSEAIRECNRVLKTGGIAIYSMPHIWHLHEEPRDFFRYTPYGIKHLFEKNGFEILENIPLAGFWVTMGQSFINYLERFNKSILRYTPIFPILYTAIHVVAKGLNKIDKAERWAWMYMVVAKKKTDATATGTAPDNR